MYQNRKINKKKSEEKSIKRIKMMRSEEKSINFDLPFGNGDLLSALLRLFSENTHKRTR